MTQPPTRRTLERRDHDQAHGILDSIRDHWDSTRNLGTADWINTPALFDRGLPVGSRVRHRAFPGGACGTLLAIRCGAGDLYWIVRWDGVPGRPLVHVDGELEHAPDAPPEAAAPEQLALDVPTGTPPTRAPLAP